MEGITWNARINKFLLIKPRVRNPGNPPTIVNEQARLHPTPPVLVNYPRLPDSHMGDKAFPSIRNS